MSPEDPDDLTRRRFLEAAAATAIAGAAVAGATIASPAIAAPPAPAATTVARYVLDRLREHGVRQLFGVPGATCDPLFAAAEAASMDVVVTSSDLEAGLCADGYARMRGLAAVAVTYGVGTMGLLSAIAGARVERSPIVVINGGPSTEDLRIQRDLGSLFSHSTGRDRSDLVMFEEVTTLARRVERAAELPAAADAAIRTALETRRPVYLEIAKDIWTASCPPPGAPIPAGPTPSGEEGALAEAIVGRLRSGPRPVLLLGVEAQRFGLQDELASLVAQLELPYATTFLGKSVLPEDTAGFVGVYAGSRSVPAVRKIVEDADPLLAVGCILGRQYRQLVTGPIDRLIQIGADGVRFGREPWRKSALGPQLAALRARPWSPEPKRLAGIQPAGTTFDQRRASLPATPAPSAASERGLGFDEVLREVGAFVDQDFVLVTDTSLSMYPAAEVPVSGRSAFVCNGVWQAIGWSVGAAAGIGIAGDRRPLVICGDGGFQMTAQSLSTLARRRVRAIVLVLDNGHYGIEQWLLEPGYFDQGASSRPRPYLALNRWRYAEIARALGFEAASSVDTVSGLKEALAAARGAPGPSLVAVGIRPHDLPSGLKGAT